MRYSWIVAAVLLLVLWLVSEAYSDVALSSSQESMAVPWSSDAADAPIPSGLGGDRRVVPEPNLGPVSDECEVVAPSVATRRIGGRVLRHSGEPLVRGLVEVISSSPGSAGAQTSVSCETDGSGGFGMEVSPEVAPGPLVYLAVSGKNACLFEGHVEPREDLHIALTENEDEGSWALSGRVSIDPLPQGERWCVDLLAERGQGDGTVSWMLASSMMDGGSVIRSALVHMPFVDMDAKQYDGAVWLVVRSMIKRTTIASRRYASLRDVVESLAKGVAFAPCLRQVRVASVGSESVVEVMCIAREAGGSGYSAALQNGEGSMVVSAGDYLIRGRSETGAFGETAIVIRGESDLVVDRWDYVFPGRWPLSIQVSSSRDLAASQLRLEMTRFERTSGRTLDSKRYDLVDMALRLNGLSDGCYRVGVYTVDRSCYGECELEVPLVSTASIELKDVCTLTVQPRQVDVRELGLSDAGSTSLFWRRLDSSAFKGVSRAGGLRNACVIPMVPCGTQIEVVMMTRTNREMMPWFGRATCQVPYSRLGVLEVPIRLASAVSGCLVTRAGRPVSGCRIALPSKAAFPDAACETAADGSFVNLLLPLLKEGQRVQVELRRVDGTSVLVDVDPLASNLRLVDPER